MSGLKGLWPYRRDKVQITADQPRPRVRFLQLFAGICTLALKAKAAESGQVLALYASEWLPEAIQ